MKKTIETSAGALTLECNAATPFIVKRLCSFDMLKYFTETKIDDGLSLDQIERFEMIIYVMHLQATKSTREALNSTMDEFPEWLAGYSIQEMTSEIIPEGSNAFEPSQLSGTSSEKAKAQKTPPGRPTVRPLTVALLMLRAKELNLSFDELEILTIGDIFDMAVEKLNDQEEWDYIATQADIDKLMR